jgi:Ni,Fe-hydrogenase III component G
MESTLKNLKEKFDSILSITNKGKIQNARVNNANELYFEIGKENLIAIAYYIYEVLNYPLVTIVATDDRKTSKNYQIRYIFSNDT